MPTHVRLTNGESLQVNAPLADVVATLAAEGRLVALSSTYGGTVHVNPDQVVFVEEPPELGLGKEAEETEAELKPPPPPATPPPSQAPPGI